MARRASDDASSARQPSGRGQQQGKQDHRLNLEHDVNRAVDLLDKLQRTEYSSWLSKDVDMSKLRDLQSILESEFFTSVRQVYEKVYSETACDMNGDSNPDIAAHAAAKATVALFTTSSSSSAAATTTPFPYGSGTGTAVAASRDPESRSSCPSNEPERTVTLAKTEEGLGFNIMGGKEQACGIYVSRIIAGGIADRAGNLRRGDLILSVNGTSVVGQSHETAVSLLKAAEDKVILTVRFSPSILSDVESRYEKTKRRAPQPQSRIKS